MIRHQALNGNRHGKHLNRKERRELPRRLFSDDPGLERGIVRTVMTGIQFITGDKGSIPFDKMQR